MTSEEKAGMSECLEMLKSQQRYELEWEWIAEDDKGTYIEFDAIYGCIIEALQSTSNSEEETNRPIEPVN